MAHAKTGDLVGALLVLRKMRDAGVAPNERTCAAVLECCLKAGRPSSAMGLVEEMRASGVHTAAAIATNAVNKSGRAGGATGARAKKGGGKEQGGSKKNWDPLHTKMEAATNAKSK